MKNLLVIRPARLPDIPKMLTLINACAGLGLMRSKNRDKLFETICHYIVAELNGNIIATQGAKPWAPRKMELLSCAVAEKFRNDSEIHKAMLEACLTRCRELGYHNFFTFTKDTTPFRHLGFVIVSKENFSKRIRIGCQGCPHNMVHKYGAVSCSATAMQLTVRG